MNGSKTIITMILAAVIVPLLAKQGLVLTAEQQTEVVGYGIAALAIVMRFFSNGPALAAVRDWFAALVAKRQPAPIDIAAITDGVIAEIKRRQAAAKLEKTT